MSREPQRLKDVLDQGQFAVTMEYNPPKGTNISHVVENAKAARWPRPRSQRNGQYRRHCARRIFAGLSTYCMNWGMIR